MIKNKKKESTFFLDDEVEELKKMTVSEDDVSCEVSSDLFQNHRENLKNVYKRNFKHMKFLFWNDDNVFSMDDYFIQLEEFKLNSTGKEVGKKNVKIEDIFAEKIKRQTILLTGNSGYGKSTFCQKIAYDWASNNTPNSYLEHFNFLVIITLCQLGEKSVSDAILEAIFNNSEDLKVLFKRANSNILVILDGFDELMDKSEVLKFLSSDSPHISHNMTIFITSILSETEELRKFTNLRYHINGFSSVQQIKYISLIFKNEQIKRNHLIKMLQIDSFYADIAKSPLMLHMLCWIQETDCEQRVESVTALYVQVLKILINQYCSRTDKCYQGIFSFLRKSKDDLVLKKGNFLWGEDLLLRLVQLYVNYVKNSTKIKAEILTHYFPNKGERQFITRIGILSSFFNNYEVCYGLIHVTIIDFLMALLIYEMGPSDNVLSLCSDQTFQFLLGLYGDDPYPEKLMERFNKLNFHPESIYVYIREIKDEDNLQKFCSKVTLTITPGELHKLHKLFDIYEFSEFNFLLPDKRKDYEILRHELINFHINHNHSHHLEIHFFLRITGDRKDSQKNFQDIRDLASLFVEFLTNVEWVKFKIYFFGIKTALNDVENMRFKKIVNPVEISEMDKVNLGANKDEKFVALQTQDSNGENIFNYLISESQYNIMKDYLK